MKSAHLAAWLNVETASTRLGLSEERVRQLIRVGQIKATKIGGWLIRPEDLDDFIRSRTNTIMSQHEKVDREGS